MWMLILATLAVAFASGLSMGSSLERGHWESAIKSQLSKRDALLARYARRLRARRAGRQHRAAVSSFVAPSRFTPVSQPSKRDAGRHRAANAA